MALSFAIAAPAVFGAVGIASDFAFYSMKRTELQAVADQSAISAANELVIGNTAKASIVSAADVYTKKAISDPLRSVSMETSYDQKANAVTVKLHEVWAPFFAHFIGMKVTPINVSATASLVGESKICVLALDTKIKGAVATKRSAYVQANDCAVYSNSTNASGISMAGGSVIEASLVCSAGGVDNKGSSSTQQVMTDCVPIKDPLAGRPAPAFGACNFNMVKVTTGSRTLDPGVYCKGLSISGDAKVTLKPGTYIIKDGAFNVQNSASVQGKDVAFFLSGKQAGIDFTNDAEIDLSGSETGDMAGLLFFDDSAAGAGRTHRISATRAHTLTGTIYLPNGDLIVDPAASVAEKSAYTAIVVKSLEVDNGPRLVINSDYGATRVPVPAGIKASGTIVLTD